MSYSIFPIKYICVCASKPINTSIKILSELRIYFPINDIPRPKTKLSTYKLFLFYCFYIVQYSSCKRFYIARGDVWHIVIFPRGRIYHLC